MRKENKNAAAVTVRKVTENTFADADDLLAAEEPLEILLRYREADQFQQKIISVTMRTPGNDPELAAGFLFTEGIIKNNDQVQNIQSVDVNRAMVTLHAGVTPILQHAERNFYTTSSCGVCGKAGIDAIKTLSVFEKTVSVITIDATVLYGLPAKLRAAQVTFNSTGGLHASALFDAAGNLIALREDVGRHNALDKIIGTALQKNILPLADAVLLLSGRASFELIQKATMAGISIVAAIGAPSSLAVQLAEEAGITLVGFLRSGSFNIYSAAKRITNLKEVSIA